MGFLDNSGDIILDAVLTDAGRQRLARGDGSFNVTKFAFGDEEINYRTFNGAHASGSSYYDLEILQTPILEAFTDNRSTMKSRCISLARTDHLYLPVIQLYENGASQKHSSGTFLVCANRTTEEDFDTVTGVLFGERPGVGEGFTRLDQGLDTNGSPPATIGIASDLIETQFTVDIDNRLGGISSVSGRQASVSFVDDDQKATYYLTMGAGGAYVSNISSLTVATDGAFNGPRGSRLEFKINISVELNSSDTLFSRLGGTTSINNKDGVSTTVKYIDTYVRVTGVTTGYAVDIPIRFIKK
tara:strand:+ start:7763 stop:8662 length:900 start_codon:yes stop_codon:yes gene_type:complete